MTDLLVKEGDTISPIVDSTQRKGYILFRANDIEHMYEVADKICESITFVYEDLLEWKPSYKIIKNRSSLIIIIWKLYVVNKLKGFQKRKPIENLHWISYDEGIFFKAYGL